MKFPGEEEFEFADGCGRYTDKDFTHFLDNALGSTNEVDYCCFPVFESKYLSEKEFDNVNKLVEEERANAHFFHRVFKGRGHY